MGIQRSAASRDILADYDEHAITVTPPKHEAAGVGLEAVAEEATKRTVTPVSKAIIIRLESASLAVAPGDGEMA